MRHIPVSIAELKRRYRSPIEAFEFLALLEDVKPCIRYCCYPDEVEDFLGFWKQHNLSFVEADFKVLVDDKNRFANKGVVVDKDNPSAGIQLFYVSKNRKIAEHAKQAELTKDYAGLGKLLGYPRCCSEFYVTEEPNREDQDFIVPLIEAAGQEVYPFANNILRRDSGLTLIFHFPCSFACKESERIGLRVLDIIRRLDPAAAEEIKKELCKDMVRKKLIRFS